MKHIEKEIPVPSSFQDLASWVSANQARLAVLTGKRQWDLLPRHLKKRIQDQLVEEQGYICAYCNGRIHKGTPEDDEQLRIEHLQPKHLFSDLTFEYSNLVGCCHGDQREADRIDPPRDLHCDVSKDSHPIPHELFPTSVTCESCVAFDNEGQISATNPIYKDAIETILNLNSDKLVRKRKPKIQPFESLDYTLDEAEQIIQALQTPDSDGKYDPYCGAVIGFIRTSYSILP